MREQAFTLIEVMVVMAIISILAGMMMPVVSRYWESEEIATTRQRMRDLKIAMVGDKTLVQNGVRTNFGFVGDNGELPFGNHSTASSGNLSYLVSRPATGYPYWSGPYLSGFGNDWDKDAWGKSFRYTPAKDAYGRYVSAELRSAGPDGIFDTPDDIVDLDVQVSEFEVTGTNKIKTTILQNNSGSRKSLDVSVTFKDPIVSTGISTLTSECVKLESFARYTTFTISANKLPIGAVDIIVNGHDAAGCGGTTNTINKYRYFVNTGADPIILPN